MRAGTTRGALFGGWLLASAACGSDDAAPASGGAGSAGSSGSAGSGAAGAAGSAGAGMAGSAGSAGSGATAGSGASAPGGAGGTAGSEAGGSSSGGGAGVPGLDVTVTPTEIDDVLTNPGMGFADFHFGWWCNLPPIDFTPQECASRVASNWPENYPASATAYFRWTWRDLEPVRDQIDFALVDTALQSANALGETLGLRVMTILEGGAGVPDWLLAAPYAVPTQSFGGTLWPDYRDPTFQSEHARFVAALAARYDGHPALDHVDVGSVGCWGEWNTACLSGPSGIFDVFAPASPAETQAIGAAYRSLIDHYADGFAETPLVMLGLDGSDELPVLLHATGRGTGWRVDCWGDWGIFGAGWNHMQDLYPAMIASATAGDPAFADVWKTAPVQLEICSTMPDWQSRGWSAAAPDGEVYRTFQWALESHASVLNAKSTPIPLEYVAAIDDLLRQNGYRFRIDSFSHASQLAAGAAATFQSDWSNVGVAPHYLPRTLAYRLRGPGGEAQLESTADTRTWLPGSWSVTDSVTIPASLPPGQYALEVALLDRAGVNPTTAPLAPLRLAIEGRGSDGWYALSTATVQ